MDQVSPPMRIALLVVLAFAGLWFAALRPKAAPVEPATPPAAGVTGAPAKAQDAVDKAGESAAGRQAATGEAAPAAKPSQTAKPAEPAKAQPAKPAEAAEASKPAPAPAADAEPATSDRPAALQRVLADLEARRTSVLLFWDRRISDDREVRRAVGDIDRHGGKVRVHVQPISRVGVFEPITRNLPVVTSPTVLIIGKDRRARSVQGLTVTRELDDLVVKALDGK